MKPLVMVLLCISLSAGAEKSPFDANVENTTLLNPNCPATLTGIYADSPGHKSSTRVSVGFVNQTDKRLIAIKLGLIGYDATWDGHDFSEEYAVPVNLKSQKETQPVWRVHEDQFALDTASGATVYIDKLMFFDGSVWKDDGTKSCSLTILGKAKPKRDHSGD